jgi:hypothetical protein
MPQCPIDHEALSPKLAAPESDLSPDLVTLVKCGTLVSADIVVCKLRAAGIEAFIPDELVAQAGLAAIGNVRVQVAPKDYEAAKAVLSP